MAYLNIHLSRFTRYVDKSQTDRHEKKKQCTMFLLSDVINIPHDIYIQVRGNIH